MIPMSLSLVPQSPERRAAMQAIGEVDRKLARGAHLPAYPYARAFFRYLKGCKRITVRELNLFAGRMSYGMKNTPASAVKSSASVSGRTRRWRGRRRSSWPFTPRIR